MVLASSVLAVLAALLTLAVVRPGPHQSPSPPFDPSYVIRMFRDRQQRLINFGYLGHMWELYALWAWVPLFVAGSLTAYNGRNLETADVAWSVFACMGLAGAVGCVVAGRLSGRLGSRRVASIALAVSGACCVLSPLVFGVHPVLLWIFLALWGATVIADSAQFSSALSEAAEPSYIGTALTVQTALGFLLTIVTIQALPLVATQVGWDSALLLLAIGPAVGVLSMTRLDRASTPDPFPDRQGTP